MKNYEPILKHWSPAVSGLGNKYIGFALACLMQDLRDKCAESDKERKFLDALAKVIVSK